MQNSSVNQTASHMNDRKGVQGRPAGSRQDSMRLPERLWVHGHMEYRDDLKIKSFKKRRRKGGVHLCTEKDKALFGKLSEFSELVHVFLRLQSEPGLWVEKKNAFFPYYSIHNTDILILLCLPTSKRKQKKKKTVAFYTYNKYRKYSGVFFRQAWFLKSTFSFWKMWLQPSDHVSGRTWPLSTKAPCKSPRRKRNVTWTSGNVIRLQTE